MSGPRTTSALITLLCVALSALVIGTATGCGDSGGDEQATTQSEAAEGSEGTEGAEESGSVPASLGTVESGAEDTVDYAQGADRAAVVRAAKKVQAAARGRAARDLRAAGVPAAQIAELQQRARLLNGVAERGSFARVALAANAISGLMPELYARYEDPVPPDVLKLDYLDREAQLRSEAGDRASIPAVVSVLSATWTGLRPQVLSADGEAVAARYDRHVQAMRRLESAARALQREASTGLELVDELENQFRRH